MDFNKGIVCSLTEEHAYFEDFCPEFETDSQELKIQLENADAFLLDHIGIHRRFKTSDLLTNHKVEHLYTDFFKRKSILNLKKGEQKPILSYTEDGVEHEGSLYRWSQILDSQIQRFTASNSWIYTLQLILYPCRLIEIRIGEEFHLPVLGKISLLDRRPEEIGASLEHHKLSYWKRKKGV